MELNELLKSYSASEISAKTKISEENLHKLAKKEFDTLRRVQALGFVSIIEREYKIELTTLRNDISSFFEFEQNEKVLFTDEALQHKEKSSSFIVKVLSTILLIALALWLLFYFGNIQIDQIQEWLVNDASKPTSETPKSTTTYPN